LTPWLIVIASVLFVVLMFQVVRTNLAVKETSAYTRVSNCIVAKSASMKFTQDEIERCYIQVEKDTHVHLERFDFQIHNEN